MTKPRLGEGCDCASTQIVAKTAAINAMAILLLVLVNFIRLGIKGKETFDAKMIAAGQFFIHCCAITVNSSMGVLRLFNGPYCNASRRGRLRSDKSDYESSIGRLKGTSIFSSAIERKRNPVLGAQASPPAARLSVSTGKL